MKIHFPRQTTKIDNNPHLPVSVIICAHNEAKNLQQYLPGILLQEYNDFEVIVVNDGSTDDSDIILRNFQSEYSHLKVLTIFPNEKKHLGKKYALDKGIQQAKNPYLLLTDADCEVISNKWIAQMVKYFDSKTEMVLGVAPYLSNETFLSKIVNFETSMTMVQYISYALWGMPYMGVGRNLAYTKSLYDKVGGMKEHIDVISGDDDLFVQSAIKHTHVAVCMEKETFMYSPPPRNFKKWWSQKTRHYTTGGHYPWWQQSLLGGFIVTKFTVYMFFILLIVTKSFQVSYIIALLSYLLSFVIFLNSVKNIFSTRIKWYEIFYMDIVYIVSMIFQGMNSKIIKQSSW